MKIGSLSTFGGVAFFTLALVGGFYTAATSWNGTIYVSGANISETNRDPAALHKNHNLTAREGLEFLASNKNRLLTAAQIVLKDENIGIELGHFFVKSHNGRKQLACSSQYNWIKLRFEVEGVTESGEKGVMEVESPCVQKEDDFSRLAPIWIPYARIMNETPSSYLELSYPDQNDVKFRFINMTADWPTNWILTSVVLSKEKFNSTESDSEESPVDMATDEPGDDIPEMLVFTRSQLKELLDRPMTLTWKHQDP